MICVYSYRKKQRKSWKKLLPYKASVWKKLGNGWSNFTASSMSICCTLPGRALATRRNKQIPEKTSWDVAKIGAYKEAMPMSTITLRLSDVDEKLIRAYAKNSMSVFRNSFACWLSKKWKMIEIQKPINRQWKKIGLIWKASLLKT